MFIIDWWNSLSLVSQIFACVAIPATLILLVQTFLLFLLLALFIGRMIPWRFMWNAHPHSGAAGLRLPVRLFLHRIFSGTDIRSGICAGKAMPPPYVLRKRPDLSSRERGTAMCATAAVHFEIKNKDGYRILWLLMPVCSHAFCTRLTAK